MKAIKHIFVLLNWVAALLLLASTLAGMVRPAAFVGFSLLSYLFFPLLMVNVAFVVLWLLCGSKHFLVSTAVIVLRWSFVTAFFQVGGHADQPAEGARTLRVMSFNMHHFYGPCYVDDTEDIQNQEERALAFVRMLREEQPDVLCLQEFLPYTNGHEVDLRDSLAALGYRHYAAAAPQYGHSASIVWSKHDIVDVQLIDSLCKLRVDLAVEGDTVRLFSLHLNSYQLTGEDHEELEMFAHGEGDKESGRQVARKFKKTILAHDQEWETLRPLIEQSPYAVVVAGDFNDTPASYIYRKMTQQLRDSYKEKGKGFGTTYHGRFPAFRIDYVMHSEGLRVLAYKRIKSDISDHYPIMVEFEMD